MEKFNFDVIIGSAPVLRFTLVIPENVADWDTTLYIKDKSNCNVLFEANGAISGEVTDAVDLGVFDVPLSASVTFSFEPNSYNYSFWRTNIGFEDPLAAGTVRFKEIC
jgi:hypothetical protein